MSYSAIYDKIEPGKYFYTIWVALPDFTQEVLEKLMAPLESVLERSLISKKSSSHIPHITLRYLGYESPQLKENIVKEKEAFKKIIGAFSPLEITADSLIVWSDAVDNIRLN